VLAEPTDSQGAQVLDMLVVGGGINGVGIARDAAGRGLSVHLVEKSDLAAATSSASSKLIHGGLRYLEHGAFRLVREALAEREVLLASAPHVIRPLPFVLPYAPGYGPALCSSLASSFMTTWAAAASCQAQNACRCEVIPMVNLCKRASLRVSSTRTAVWTIPGWSSSMRVMLRRMGQRSRRVPRCARRGA